MNRRGFLSFLITAPVVRALPWAGIASVIKPIAPALSALCFSEIVAITLRKHKAQIAANIIANNELLRSRLRRVE